MKILFLTGWKAPPGGVKPTYLREHGHPVIEPKLDDDDFGASIEIAQQEFNVHQPDVVLGLSRGGAVAMNIEIGDTPLVLMCPGWKRWGRAKSVGKNTVLLHSRADDIVPFSFSQELLRNSGLPADALVETGNDHFLSDPESLQRMLDACEQVFGLVDVTVYYLEMLSRPDRSVSPRRDGLTVEKINSPTVEYYRRLYDAVGKDYHWLSRRKMSDEDLSAVLNQSGSELHVLKVDGCDAGFAELDARNPDEVELVQFGIISDYFGKGLGSWFLNQMIDHVWSTQPKRFWLHTCTLDHPAALPMYENAGFVRFKEEQVRREL